jgi:hypothetical protein
MPNFPPLRTVISWVIFCAFISGLFVALDPDLFIIENSPHDFYKGSKRSTNVTENSIYQSALRRFRVYFQQAFVCLIVLVYTAELGPLRSLSSFAEKVGLGILFNIHDAVDPTPLGVFEDLNDLPDLVHGEGAPDDLFDPTVLLSSSRSDSNNNNNNSDRSGRNNHQQSPQQLPAFAFDPMVGMVPREVYNRWRENESERRNYLASNNSSKRSVPPVRRPQIETSPNVTMSEHEN